MTYQQAWYMTYRFADADSCDTFIAKLHNMIRELKAMQADNVQICFDDISDGFVNFYTDDHVIARKYNMIERIPELEVFSQGL